MHLLGWQRVGANPQPAYVAGARWDVLGWNQAAAALFTHFATLPDGRRNLVWWWFTDPRLGRSWLTGR